MSPETQRRPSSGAPATILPDFFEADRQAVDCALEKFLPPESMEPPSIHTAMRYSVFAGGKRIRPILCLETARIFEPNVDLQESPAMHPACAIEFIHTYSLIHDDLPALDNDDLRRGKPTSHKKFGEATAILAGDGLLTLAFETVGQSPASAERIVAMLQEISGAAGTVNGMVGGQVADLENEGKRIEPKTLEYIHRSKTAALIRAQCNHRGDERGRGNCRRGPPPQIWRNHRLGLSGHRRHPRRGRIFGGAGQNRRKRYRATESHLSRGIRYRALARNRG